MSKTEDPTDEAVADAFDALEEDEQHALVALAKTLGYSDPVQRAREAATSRRGFLGTVAGASAAGVMAYSAGRAEAGSDQVGTIGTASKPVDLVGEDISAETVDPKRVFTGSRAGAVIVHKSGGTWYADGDSGSVASGTDPATVLQAAADEGGHIYVTSPMKAANGDRLTSTVQVDLTDTVVDCLGHRVEGDANPLFYFTEFTGGLHNVFLLSKDSNDTQTSNDLVHMNEAGRKMIPVLKNVYAGFTAGRGVWLRGVQQTTIQSLTAQACKKACLYLTDNEAGDLDTNSITVIDFQHHGSSTEAPVIEADTNYGNGLAAAAIAFQGGIVENGRTDGTGYNFDFGSGVSKKIRFSDWYIDGLASDASAFRCDFHTGTFKLDNVHVGPWTTGTSAHGIHADQTNVTLNNVDIDAPGDGVLGDFKDSTLKVYGGSEPGTLDINRGTVVLGSGAGTLYGVQVDTKARGGEWTLTGDSGRFQPQVERAAIGSIPALGFVETTNSSGEVGDTWDGDFLLKSKPRVQATTESDLVTTVEHLTETYNSTTYYTGVRVTAFTDFAGTTASSDERVAVDVLLD